MSNDLCSNDTAATLASTATDYFTYIPSGCNNHFTSETPLASPVFSPEEALLSDPCNPLLASRQNTALPSPSTSPRMSGNILRLQTNAAHGTSSKTRPAPRPTQNVLQVTSDGYSSSSSGSDSSSSNIRSSNEIARCSRCQRTPSIDIQTGHWNMVQYGLNLWYCSRCAGLVGLPKR